LFKPLMTAVLKDISEASALFDGKSISSAVKDLLRASV
jgi:hypothetical protein